jgi:hypothetical protein
LSTSSSNAHVFGTGSSAATYLSSFGSGIVIINGFPNIKANNNNSGLRLASTTPVNSGNAQLISAIGVTNGSRISVGSGAAMTSNNTSPTPFNYSRATIGSSDGSATGQAQDPFFGDISEILIYDRALSTTEEAAVRAYLSAKYGL